MSLFDRILDEGRSPRDCCRVTLDPARYVKNWGSLGPGEMEEVSGLVNSVLSDYANSATFKRLVRAKLVQAGYAV